MKKICFLHGFLGHPLDWEGVIQSLEGAWDPTFSLTPDPIAVSKLKSSTDLLVGYSMGGRIALDLVAKGAIHTSALVLISAHPGLETEKEKEERRLFENHWLSILHKESVKTFLNKWYAQPLFSKLKKIPSDRFSLTKEKIRCQWDQFNILKQPPLWDFLQKTSIPILYIAGESDLKYCHIAKRLKTFNPNIQIAIIPEASHAVHLERPQEIAQCLELFDFQ
ncbi:MAG: alpha/beta fold hydrolase [Chlamydiia bacterium]|nr:alpha/beta fold hydrolase [Chlamydiia bacterium]